MESFNGMFRDELLDRELFLSLPEARVVLDQWRMDYNHRRPHGGLKWMTPAAFVAGLDDTASGVGPALQPASRVPAGLVRTGGGGALPAGPGGSPGPSEGISAPTAVTSSRPVVISDEVVLP